MRIGILGGGQLARMLALAGHPLGFSFVFIDPAPDACAQALGEHRISDWTGDHLIEDLAGCDRVTFDFENVPASTLAQLTEHFNVAPCAQALSISQDRLSEKTLFEKHGTAVAPHAAVSDRPALLAAMAELGVPAILKTRQMGYDGKGQYRLDTPEDCEPAWQSMAEAPGGLILEKRVPFLAECALTAVRSQHGEVRFYPLTWTHHEAGILRFAMAGARWLESWQHRAEHQVRPILEALDYVGAITVELFVTEAGLVVNEMAPRVHNSAHWTLDGAVCSQFENHLRAIAGLPLGSTAATGASLMINFIGGLPSTDALTVNNLHWHDYAKAPRAGRKVGHATWVVEDEQTLVEHVSAVSPAMDDGAFQALTGWIKSVG